MYPLRLLRCRMSRIRYKGDLEKIQKWEYASGCTEDDKVCFAETWREYLE